MGKSNSLYVANKANNKNEEIQHILNADQIKTLEKINEQFIKKIITSFSNLIKNNVQFNFVSIKINTYTDNDKDIKYLFSNIIEMINLDKQSYIFFSDNLLSVCIDLLFGGNGTYIEKMTKKRKITYTEKIISQQIIKLIFSAYFKSCKNFFSVDIKNFGIKIFDIKTDIFIKEDYITNYFNFSINGIEIFLSILLPLTIVQKEFQKINTLENNGKSLINNMDNAKNLPMFDLYDVKLDIIINLIISSEVKYNHLSIGDVLIIDNPDQIIAYIKKIPIFFGYYKNVNQKSVVFLKEFIYKNLDINKDKDFLNE